MNLKEEGIERTKEVCIPWGPELHKQTNKKWSTSPPNSKVWKTAEGKAFSDKYF